MFTKGHFSSLVFLAASTQLRSDARVLRGDETFNFGDSETSTTENLLDETKQSRHLQTECCQLDDGTCSTNQRCNKNERECKKRCDGIWATVPVKSVTFFAIGDVPYSDMEACLIPHELSKLSLSNFEAKFLVHLGDIRDGKPDPTTGLPRPCPETLHQGIATIFEYSPVPTFFVPGDNGWLGCYDADESYTFWQNHLFTYNERTDLGWPELGANVTRHPNHTEFFSFFLEDVLFLGQGLPGSGDDEEHAWEPRDWYLEANANWTRQQFAEHASVMKAVVIFGHAGGSINEGYYLELKKIAEEYSETNILFLEDGHSFGIDNEFWDAENIYSIKLDDTVTPTAITVITSPQGKPSEMFQYDRRCPCSDGHRPTELESYKRGDCKGVCETNELCAGEDPCSPDGIACG